MFLTAERTDDTRIKTRIAFVLRDVCAEYSIVSRARTIALLNHRPLLWCAARARDNSVNQNRIRGPLKHIERTSIGRVAYVIYNSIRLNIECNRQ